MIPESLTIVSVVFVCLGLVSAAVIFCDLLSRPQPMKIMNPVWILTGLWGSILGLIAYFWFGREPKPGQDKPKMMTMKDGTTMPMKDMKMPMKGMDMKGKEEMQMGDMDMGGMKMGRKHPYYQSVALAAFHCGAGCTLADIIGGWFSFWVVLNMGGSIFLGNCFFSYFLALFIGVFFQYFAISEMQKISFGKGLWMAFKADVLSLTSWQVGMFGWMALVTYVFFPSGIIVQDKWAYWFMMQVAMLCGFLCAYPMNMLLIHLGIKKGM